MKLKNIIPWTVAGFGLGVMLFYLFKVENAFSEMKSPEEVRFAIRNYHISIWCGWVLMTSSATYYQWTKKKYALFALDYLIVILAFIFLRHYLNLGEERDLWSFGDTFKMSVNYMSMRNALLMIFMTAFVQAAIWLFSSKWHRK